MSRIVVNIDHDAQKVAVNIPPAAAELLTIIRTSIPGVYWDSINRIWKLPLTRRSTLALRKFLTGVDVGITLSTQDALTLKEVADSKPSPDAVIKNNEIVVSFEFTAAYQAMMQDLEAKGRNESWILSPKDARKLYQRVIDSGSDLILSDEIVQLAQIPPAKLPGYNGYVQSLERTPIEALEVACIEMNTPRSKAKKKETLAQRLEKNDFTSVLDLVHLFPLRYIDRSSPRLIRDLQTGETAAVLGTVTDVPMYDAGRKLSKVVIADGSGTKFSIAFFRQPWISSKYRVGDEVIVSGRYEPYKSPSGSLFPQFANVQIDKVGGEKGAMPVVPVYPQSEKTKVTTWDIVSCQQEIFTRLNPALVDPLPTSVLSKYDLMSRDTAYRMIHFPSSPALAEQARKRLVYEELLTLQLYIQQQKKVMQQLRAVPHVLQGNSRNEFAKSFPYELTGAQKRAQASIEQDLVAPHPMHRLLQGDVGAGKSAIASIALLGTVDAGHQGALMAPTEILAEQLFIGLKNDVNRVNLVSIRTGETVKVEFLGNKTKAAEKRRILKELAEGTIDIVVGTHSLISEGVVFADLGLAVIDEQHRFGAAQRTRLRNSRHDDYTPHLLVMTATPIPRTGAMVMYGDLDLTILDEMPPGRVPIETTWIDTDTSEMINEFSSPVWQDVLDEVAEGRQAYVIASLVEESEKIAAQSAEETYEALRTGPLSSVRVGIVHGRQDRDLREKMMSEFAAGEIDVLVATTVIEVGVNVPNSTVMVVLDAGRFGIAQLHQIRGRVGRSSLPSRCYLVGQTTTETGRARLNALVSSTDGFYLSEKDLEIRGEGALFGERQSGESDLKIARLRENLDVLELARVDAAQLLSSQEDISDLTREIDALYRDESIQS